VRQFIYKIVLKLVPKAPVLEIAIQRGHAYTTWTGREVAYIVSSACPNPIEVNAAIQKRRYWHQYVTMCELIVKIVVFAMVASIASHISNVS
jgi:hypothetical protein